MSNNHKHIDVLFSITFNYMARKKAIYPHYSVMRRM